VKKERGPALPCIFVEATLPDSLVKPDSLSPRELRLIHTYTSKQERPEDEIKFANYFLLKQTLLNFLSDTLSKSPKFRIPDMTDLRATFQFSRNVTQSLNPFVESFRSIRPLSKFLSGGFAIFPGCFDLTWENIIGGLGAVKKPSQIMVVSPGIPSNDGILMPKTYLGEWAVKNGINNNPYLPIPDNFTGTCRALIDAVGQGLGKFVADTSA